MTTIKATIKSGTKALFSRGDQKGHGLTKADKTGLFCVSTAARATAEVSGVVVEVSASDLEDFEPGSLIEAVAPVYFVDEFCFVNSDRGSASYRCFPGNGGAICRCPAGARGFHCKHVARIKRASAWWKAAETLEGLGWTEKEVVALWERLVSDACVGRLGLRRMHKAMCAFISKAKEEAAAIDTTAPAYQPKELSRLSQVSREFSTLLVILVSALAKSSLVGIDSSRVCIWTCTNSILFSSALIASTSACEALLRSTLSSLVLRSDIDSLPTFSSSALIRLIMVKRNRISIPPPPPAPPRILINSGSILCYSSARAESIRKLRKRVRAEIA